MNRETALHWVGDLEAELEGVKAQLAEAVGLLLDASDPKGPCIRYAAIKDFLLRYAQAEQQEAQGTQAVEVLFKSPEELEKALFDHGSVVTSRLVADRIFAALAAQPAAHGDKAK